MNPYAPPKANVEQAPAGGLWRSGRLVRVDRKVPLPDRCVVCNAAAEGDRLKRKLYYSPMAWRVGAPLAPFLVLLAGAWLEFPYAGLAFFPLIVILFFANMFVRKSLKLELGVCERHRQLRLTFVTLSWLCAGGAFLSAVSVNEGMFAVVVMLGCFAALLILGMVQSYVGVQAVRLNGLSADHAWLSGTGERFRNELPELN